MYTMYGVYMGFFFGGVKGIMRYRKLDKARLMQKNAAPNAEKLSGFQLGTAHFFQQGTRYAINTGLFTATFTAVDIMCRENKIRLAALDKINKELNTRKNGQQDLPSEEFRVEHKAIAGLTTGSTFGLLAAISYGNVMSFLGYGATIGLLLGIIGSIMIPVEANFSTRTLVPQAADASDTKKEQVQVKVLKEPSPIDDEQSIRDLVQDESHLLEKISKVATQK